MTKQTNADSILSSTPKRFLEKNASNGYIQDYPELGLLEFYPAGYTKGGRQEILCSLWNAAADLSREDQDIPFSRRTHTITLVPEPNNPHDRYAMNVFLRVKSPSLKKKLSLDETSVNIGYVPKKINRYVLENKHMITGGYILRVREKVHDKYYSCKVVITYTKEVKTIRSMSLSRFSAILGEL